MNIQFLNIFNLRVTAKLVDTLKLNFEHNINNIKYTINTFLTT